MYIAKISSPIRGENSLLNEAVEATVRPIGYAIDVAMFHRIEVDVIDVSLEILIISNRVLPVSASPDPFSRLATLLVDLARASRPRENPLFIKLQRVEKSASLSGNAQSA